MASYIAPQLRAQISPKGGKGLFAISPIEKGVVLIDYSKGLGKFVSSAEADLLYNQGMDHMIQVDDDLFFAATERTEFEEADLLNHSCDPNAGIHGTLVITAMRDIEPDEEITIDYAMTESSDYRFPCACGARECRKMITGEDWRIPELQKMYAGYFSDYLSRKIPR
jgi:uncharacterized protein